MTAKLLMRFYQEMKINHRSRMEVEHLTAKNGEKPQKPHGSGAPDAKGGMPGFKSTGETSTVTLGDNVIVQKAGMNQEKTDASVSDIKKGCIIEIALDGDNVSKVLIREETGKNAKNTDKETSGSRK